MVHDLSYIYFFLTIYIISESQDTYPPISMSATYIRFYLSRMFDKSTHYHTIRRKESVIQYLILRHQTMLIR